MKVNKTLNHTGAHLLAAAVMKLYPNVKIGIGPAIDEGFYYDFKFENPINDQDLKKIEKTMKKMTSGGHKMELVDKVDFSDQPFKQELIDELEAKGEKLTYYGMINPSNNTSIFTDLCAGDHVSSISKLKHFKLLHQSAAYWRGDSKGVTLTRIYGTAWESKEELDSYLFLLKDRKERDHRKIGKEMGIFMFHPMSIQGFPIWLENGMIVKNAIQTYVRKTERAYGFREVQTPAFGEKSLYETSGHWEHYKDDMFPVIDVENENLIMRPMTCPHHILIYAAKRRSYRDLPIRMSEQARLYRYEKSGALTGLERVRSMELTEGHIFAREDQIVEEFKNSYKLILEALNKFNIKIDYVSLSLRDPENTEKYHGDDAMWEKAENDLRIVLNELEVEYIEKIGEAAFYGPKIDIQVTTALGHEITLSTLQLDFLLPSRFGITYIDKDEQKKTPVLIHRGLIGTYERFIAILLEQTKGILPFWVAPRQIVILPVADVHHEYATEVFKALELKDYRVELDTSSNRIGKKIRLYQTEKVKYQLVIGDNEVENKTITYRKYGSEEQVTVLLDEFNPK